MSEPKAYTNAYEWAEYADKLCDGTTKVDRAIELSVMWALLDIMETLRGLRQVSSVT